MGDPTRGYGSLATHCVSGVLERAALLMRTARYLRARQAVHQVVRAVRGASTLNGQIPAWNAARADAVTRALRDLGTVREEQGATEKARGWMHDHVVGLGLNEAWTGDWRAPGPSPLWRYHLLYHDHLADLAWHSRRLGDAQAHARLTADLRRWMGAWKEGESPAWDAYPVAVRLVNWIRILSWTGDSLDADIVEMLHDGIARHVAFLRSNMEWHLDGNHLLRDTWALAVGTSVLNAADGVHGTRWHSEAIGLFHGTMAEQVLADGWHEERSPMYHVRALRDAIEVEAVLDAVGSPSSAPLADDIRRMAAALPWMLRADGSLWALNDTAGDHDVALAPLLARGSVDSLQPDGVHAFAEAHTVVVADAKNRDRLRIDVGGPAPAHQPGHAHAGALGFEMDISGVPLIVDAGCSGYDGDTWRPYLRGTAAHNTVRVDGKNQSELWATFRVARRAAVSSREYSGASTDFVLSASCRPYHDRRLEHQRQYRRDGRIVRIVDLVQGAVGRLVEGFLHFGPQWDVETSGEGTFVARSGMKRATIIVLGPAELTLHRGERSPIIGWHARGFNDVVPTWTLRMRDENYVGQLWTTTISPS